MLPSSSCRAEERQKNQHGLEKTDWTTNWTTLPPKKHKPSHDYNSSFVCYYIPLSQECLFHYSEVITT